MNLRINLLFAPNQLPSGCSKRLKNKKFRVILDYSNMSVLAAFSASMWNRRFPLHSGLLENDFLSSRPIFVMEDFLGLS